MLGRVSCALFKVLCAVVHPISSQHEQLCGVVSCLSIVGGQTMGLIGFAPRKDSKIIVSRTSEHAPLQNKT